MATVTFTKASRSYPGSNHPAVDALDLEIADGEFLVLVGPSGCGKSTTLRMLAGLEPVDTGYVHIGETDVTMLPPRVRDPLEALRSDSARHTDMTLTLALSYGGREEIIAMARRVAEDRLDPAAIDARAIEDRLWTEGLPPLELVVRTSGEFRVSNFLLWQLAYAEIHFTETLWPDFGELDLLLALEDFQKRERRFGKTSAQLRTSA